MEELICLIDQSESDLQSKFITAIQFGNDHVVDFLLMIKKAILEFCIGASHLKLPSLLSFSITKMICEPFSNCDISMHSFFIVIDRVKLFSV